MSCDRYDAKTDTWTQVAPISSARDAVGVCLLGDRLYAVGGYDGQQYLSEVEAYDAQSNEWKQVRTAHVCSCSVLLFNVYSYSSVITFMNFRLV